MYVYICIPPRTLPRGGRNNIQRPQRFPLQAGEVVGEGWSDISGKTKVKTFSLLTATIIMFRSPEGNNSDLSSSRRNRLNWFDV